MAQPETALALLKYNFLRAMNTGTNSFLIPVLAYHAAEDKSSLRMQTLSVSLKPPQQFRTAI